MRMMYSHCQCNGCNEKMVKNAEAAMMTIEEDDADPLTQFGEMVRQQFAEQFPMMIDLEANAADLEAFLTLSIGIVARHSTLMTEA